jgi:hypothetical protein
MTDNVQLQRFINKNIKLLQQAGKSFLGVHASNDLPNVGNHTNACLIVNYSPMNKNSEGHWCTISDLNSTKNKNAYWFDSYGKKPDADDQVLDDSTNFTDYLVKNSKFGNYDYNHIDFQGYNDDVCGEYALISILYGPPEEGHYIWKKLKSITDPKERDQFVRKFIGIRK